MPQVVPTHLPLRTSAAVAVLPDSNVAPPPDSGLAPVTLVSTLGLDPTVVLPPGSGLAPPSDSGLAPPPDSGLAPPPDSGLAPTLLVPPLGLEPALAVPLDVTLPPDWVTESATLVHPLGLEPAILPPTSDLGLIHSADGNIAESLDQASEIPDSSCREPRAMLNPIADPPLSSDFFGNKNMSPPYRTMAPSLDTETIDIVSIVDLLKYVAQISSHLHIQKISSRKSKAQHIYTLDAIRVFVSCDKDARALRAAKVIPHLTSFLDIFAYIPIDIDVPCRVALIFSQMLHDRKSWEEMLQAGVTFSLRHLLSHPVSNEVLVAVANIMGKCAYSVSEFPREPWHYFPAIVLRPLIRLLSSTSMEVRLAAAEALRNISMQGDAVDNPIAECLAHEGALRRFCDLAPCCRNLAEMEVVLDAIVHFASARTMNDEDIEMVQTHILQPLLTRSRSQDPESQVAVCRALQTLSEVSSFRKGFARTMVIPQAKLLCSSDDDEIFIEAVWVVTAWAKVDCAEHIAMSQIRRLICLLSHNKDRVVERACLCLAYLRLSLAAILEEMENLDGTRRLMEILFERPPNPCLWRAVERTLDYFSDDPAFKTSLMEQGLISALTRCLSLEFGPCPVVESLSNIISGLLEWEGATASFLNAGAVGRITNLLSSPECTAVPVFTYILSALVLRPEASPSLLLRAGAIRPFVRSISWVLEDRDCLVSSWPPIRAMEAILHIIDHSHASRAEFRVAGVEDILSAYLPRSSPQLRIKILSTLRLLRSDVESALDRT
jgi:hypothetical protein